MTIRFLLAPALLAGLACLAPPEAPVFNASGTWQLDLLRTRFPKEPPFKSLVFKIDHQEPHLRIVVTTVTNDGEKVDHLDLTTDGVEQKGTFHGRPAVASAFWEYGRLVFLVKQQSPTGEITYRRQFKLGDKGQIMTTILTMTGQTGEKRRYEFFIKQ